MSKHSQTNSGDHSGSSRTPQRRGVVVDFCSVAISRGILDEKMVKKLRASNKKNQSSKRNSKSSKSKVIDLVPPAVVAASSAIALYSLMSPFLTILVSTAIAVVILGIVKIRA